MRIREERERIGMSQVELARRVGFKNRSSINKIEVGDNGVPVDKLLLIAKELNVSTNYLMGESEWRNEAERNKKLSEWDKKYNTRRMQLLELYDYTLNKEGRDKLLDFANDLIQIDKYKVK